MELIALFASLRAAIARQNREARSGGRRTAPHRLTVRETGGLLDVEYAGEAELVFDDDTIVTILDDLLRLLASAEVAPILRSFAFRTPAAWAANGTCSISIDGLFGDRPFPRLARFALDQGPGEHGYKILASDRNGGDGFYEEAGVLADLLTVAPSLEELVTPSPPGDAFFRGEAHPLRALDVDAGFGHADFVRNLAGCSRFPELRRLVFTDDRNRYLDDWPARTTRFADYVALFESPLAARLESIALRGVVLTGDQVRRLRELGGEGVEITNARPT